MHASTSCSLLCLLPGIAPGAVPREDRTIVTKTRSLGKGRTPKSKVRRAWSLVTNNDAPGMSRARLQSGEGVLAQLQLLNLNELTCVIQFVPLAL